MRDAQGEEFKHFCMDLEFLLRRTPLWREIARGHPLPGGRHRRARRGGRGGGGRGRRPTRGAPLAGGESLGIGSLRGSAPMSHLLREHAPITEAGWELLDDEARERLDAGARRPQARRLLRPARLGALGDEPRPRRARSPTRPATASTASQRRVLPLVELRAPLRGRRAPSCATPTAAPRTSTSTPLDEAAHRIARRRERRRLPRLGGGRDHRHRRGLAARPDRARRGLRALPAPRRQGGRGAARAPASTGPYGLALGPEAYTARARDHRARRLPAARPPARDPRRPDRLGARRRRARSCSACAAATSCSSPARTSRSATTHHDADAVQLYLEESFSFRVATPEAAVALP